jgi:deazaflavin-dependent oxidoreductase (nitroreductase family)
MALATRLRSLRWFNTPAFAAVGRRILPQADRSLQRVTRGRYSLSQAVGMPLLLLHTTGRRTGRERATPLTYALDGDDLLVIGSNWGQPGHPAWALNLLADPVAAVEIGGSRRGVRAHVLSGEDRERAWPALLEVWPHYAAYAVRAGRDLHVFRLSATEGEQHRA